MDFLFSTDFSPPNMILNGLCVLMCVFVDVALQGLFSKRRHLILTDAPRLYYIDPVAMELKGEIPW